MPEDLFSLEAISMGHVKEKLRNLKSYLPDRIQPVYDFAERLAGTLGNKVVPEGFNMAAEAAVRYIQAYYEVYGEPILTLRACIPEVARTVCPVDFAKRVGEIHAQVGESIKK
jgi:hypothetical protein